MTRLKRLKQRVRNEQKRLRNWYLRSRYEFGPDEFAAALKQAGIGWDDTILVHVSWDGFEAFRGKVTDLLATLRDTVGPGGTILMPTMAFHGSAIDYANDNPEVDLKRTASRMGLPTEFFRRQKDVVRSIHPTHAVAAWGANARSMVADHHLCRTPCGRSSPFGRLLDHDGRILFLGTDIEAMTFFHTVEEILEADLPRSPFTEEEFHLTTVAPDGARYTTQTRLFDRQLSRTRRISAVVPELKKRGAWRMAHVGTLDIIVLDASAVLEAVRSSIGDGVQYYGE